MDKNDKEEVERLFKKHIKRVISGEISKIEQSGKTIETYKNAWKMIEDWRSEYE